MAAKQQNPLVKVTPARDYTAYNSALSSCRPDANQVAENVRHLCERFGVPTDLPAKDRAMILAKAIAAAGGMGGGWKRRP